MQKVHQSYREFDQLRVSQDTAAARNPLTRFPPFGLLYKTLMRVRNLGKIWATQAALSAALIEQLEATQHRLASLEAALATSQAEGRALPPVAAALSTPIVTDPVARQSALDMAAEEIGALKRTLAHLDDRVRVNSRLARLVIEQHPTELPPLAYNKVLAYEDFAHPALLAAIRQSHEHEIERFGPDFPYGVEYRGYWESGMSLKTLADHGLLNRDSAILGVGTGMDVTGFYLTRYVDRVHLADRVGDHGAPANLLAHAEWFAPFPFEADRLVVEALEGNTLPYADDAFDAVFCPSAIEHVGNFEDVAQMSRELARVLKPGGLCILTTEYRFSGAPGGDGYQSDARGGVYRTARPNEPTTLLFSLPEIQRYILEASGLRLIDDLLVTPPEKLTPYLVEADDFKAAFSAYLEAEARKTPGGDRLAWDVKFPSYPQIALRWDNYRWTSVHLALRK